MTYVTSIHISLIKESHMSTPNFTKNGEVQSYYVHLKVNSLNDYFTIHNNGFIWQGIFLNLIFVIRVTSIVWQRILNRTCLKILGPQKFCLPFKLLLQGTLFKLFLLWVMKKLTSSMPWASKLMDSQLTQILGHIHTIPSLYADQLTQARVHMSHAVASSKSTSILLIFRVTYFNVTAVASSLSLSKDRQQCNKIFC